MANALDELEGLVLICVGQMPELPEVETIRRQLQDEIVGYRIVKVWGDTPKQLQPTPAIFKKEIIGSEIVEIYRRAKLLIFKVKKGATTKYFLVHLKLTGRLLLREPDYPPDDYVHIVLRLLAARAGSPKEKNRALIKESPVLENSGPGEFELRFADSRKLGFFRLVPTKVELDGLLSQFGPEPLDGLTKQEFTRILQATSRKIKDVLMDQKIIAGIGNIYANDTLWLAKIHPECPADSLTATEVNHLFDAAIEVLQEGLQAGGASDQWYRQIHGEKGEYQDHLKVYARKGKPCLRHPKTRIEYLKVGQRGTFVCPRCQLYQASLDIGLV